MLRADTTTSAPNAPAQAPPVRVVRLSHVEGTVQMLHGNQMVFSQALMNMPVTQGSRIDTGVDGKAEIEFEDGSVARLAPNSSLEMDKLQVAPDGTLITQMGQLGGLAYYELRDDSTAPYTVVFGNRTVTLGANSTFRVDLDASPADLAVLDGNVKVAGGTAYQAALHQGQTIQFDPTNTGKYTLANTVAANGWDQWNDSMDAQEAEAAQNPIPAPMKTGGGGSPLLASMYGTLPGPMNMLNGYGGWYPIPGYGNVWQPFGMDAGFDPYGFGAWGMMPGMGAFFASGYPWGWMPFHYGGWSYIDGFGWGWMPGGGGYGGGYSPYGTVYNAPAGYAGAHPPTAFSTRPGSGGPARGALVQVGHAPPNGAGMHPAAASRAGGFASHSINFHGATIQALNPAVANHIGSGMHHAGAARSYGGVARGTGGVRTSGAQLGAYRASFMSNRSPGGIHAPGLGHNGGLGARASLGSFGAHGGRSAGGVHGSMGGGHAGGFGGGHAGGGGHSGGGGGGHAGGGGGGHGGGGGGH
ncbi:MAG: DUF6600 domain-containing protein [Acidobacteriaceae bacterium]